MATAKQAKSQFTPGTEVRVRSGVSDPDFPDIPLGGWTGAVIECEVADPPLYLVRWNEHTFAQMHPVYRKRSERDGLEVDEMWLSEGDLEPETGEPAVIDQPTRIEPRPLDPADQDDRIRAVFDLTSDDPLSVVGFDTLRAYRNHLAENLAFPFEATWERETGAFSSNRLTVTVTGMGGPDEDFRVDDMHRLICKIRIEGRPADAPLAELQLAQKASNHRAIADYRYWFCNWA
ncbi:MAG: calcium-binding protein [Planctomycetaceae bacterium]